MKRKTKKPKTRLLPMDELRARPCLVDGRPALVHRWHEKPTLEGYTLQALVEYRDGSVEFVSPEKIRFTDQAQYINEP